MSWLRFSDWFSRQTQQMLRRAAQTRREADLRQAAIDEAVAEIEQTEQTS